MDNAAIFTCRLNSAAGTASSSARLKVIATKAPEIIKKPADAKVPVKGQATFEAKIIATPPPQVSWRLNGKELEEIPEKIVMTSVPRENLFRLNLLNCEELQTGQIDVVAKNLAGEAEASSKINVTGLAPYFIEKPNKCVILEGETAILHCKIGGDPFPKLQWEKGRKVLETAGDIKTSFDQKSGRHMLKIKNFTTQQSGTYTVLIENEYGNEETSATIIVTEKEEEAQDWKSTLKHIE